MRVELYPIRGYLASDNKLTWFCDGYDEIIDFGQLYDKYRAEFILNPLEKFAFDAFYQLGLIVLLFAPGSINFPAVTTGVFASVSAIV